MKIKQAALSLALASVISTASIIPVQASVLEFAFDGLFTLLDTTGSPIQNNSYPYYSDTTWSYGFRTQISGTLTLDTELGIGSGIINPFEFLNGGTAHTHDLNFISIGDGAGGAGSLVISNMLFDWNGNQDISMNIVLDATGLFNAITNGIVPGDTITGEGTIPASNDMLATGPNGPGLPIGLVPIATTTFDTDGVSITGDDGIGGSAIEGSPVVGFNPNIDMTSITFTGCSADCAPSVIPIPAAVWLFGSGLIGLFGFSGRRKK